MLKAAFLLVASLLPAATNANVLCSQVYEDPTLDAITCYAGSYLKVLLQEGRTQNVSIAYIFTHLRPFLGGGSAINSTLNDDSDDVSCETCISDPRLHARLLESYNNLTDQQRRDYETGGICSGTLFSRLMSLTPTSDDGMWFKDLNPKQPLDDLILDAFDYLFTDDSYTAQSCLIPLPTTADNISTLRATIRAFIFGAISAVSFPLGAAASLYYTPSPTTTGRLMGFGNGALLCALSVEMFGSADSSYQELRDHGLDEFARLSVAAVMLGAIVGCCAFIFLNRLLEARSDHDEKRPRMSVVFHTPNLNLARSPATPQQQQGEATSPRPRRSFLSSPLTLAASPRRPSVKTDSNLSSGLLNSADSLGAISLEPTTSSPCPRDYVKQALDDAKTKKRADSLRSSDDSSGPATALSVWLGVLMDGIPESMVIGFMSRQDRISSGFIVGVFLSNFPEALSAGALMKQKYGGLRVVLLWGSLMVMTSLLAAVTALALPGRMCQHEIDWLYVFREFIEGMAAGAMLCMLVCVAIPESYHLGEDLTGLATMLGFLATLLVIVVSGTSENLVFNCATYYT